MKKSKKLAPVYILDYLERFTDAEHPVSIQTLVEQLEEMSEYDLELERKAVGRNIRMLIDEGLIESYGGKRGCFFDNRIFDEEELRLMIHSILFNHTIPREETGELVNKLSEIGGAYFDPRVDAVKMLDGWRKTEDLDVIKNIDLITQAVRSGGMVKFDYYRYGLDKKLHPSTTHMASPYQIIMRNQEYYLMAYSENYNDMVFFRVDHIRNMEFLEKKKKPLKTVPGYEDGIDFSYLSGPLPFMYSDKPVWITMETTEKFLDQIIRQFGTGKDIYAKADPKEKGKVRVDIKTSPMAMERWAKQHLEEVEITAPIDLRNRIRESLERGLEKYGGKKPEKDSGASNKAEKTDKADKTDKAKKSKAPKAK